MGAYVSTQKKQQLYFSTFQSNNRKLTEDLKQMIGIKEIGFKLMKNSESKLKKFDFEEIWLQKKRQSVTQIYFSRQKKWLG